MLLWMWEELFHDCSQRDLSHEPSAALVLSTAGAAIFHREREWILHRYIDKTTEYR